MRLLMDFLFTYINRFFFIFYTYIPFYVWGTSYNTDISILFNYLFFFCISLDIFFWDLWSGLGCTFFDEVFVAKSVFYRLPVFYFIFFFVSCYSNFPHFGRPVT